MKKAYAQMVKHRRVILPILLCLIILIPVVLGLLEIRGLPFAILGSTELLLVLFSLIIANIFSVMLRYPLLCQIALIILQGGATYLMSAFGNEGMPFLFGTIISSVCLFLFIILIPMMSIIHLLIVAVRREKGKAWPISLWGTLGKIVSILLSLTVLALVILAIQQVF